MNKILQVLVLTFGLLLGAVSAFAQGVELTPAYLTGQLSISNGNFADHISSFYVYAYYTDPSAGQISSNVQGNSDGTYTLTLNTPSDGSVRTYTLQVYGYLKDGFQFNQTNYTVTVQAGQTYTQNFTLGIANLEVRLLSDNGLINNWYAYWSPYEFPSGSNSPGVSSVDQTYEIPANQDLNFVFGNVYPSDTTTYAQYTLLAQNLSAVAPGDTAVASWEFSFPAAPPPPVTGTLSGNVTVAGVPTDYTLSYHWLVAGSLSQWLYKDGDFSTTTPAGDYYFSWLYSAYNANYPDGSSQSMTIWWPGSVVIPNYPTQTSFNVPAGGTYTINLNTTLVPVTLTPHLSGTETAADLTSLSTELYPTDTSHGTQYMYASSNGRQNMTFAAPTGAYWNNYISIGKSKTDADGTFNNWTFNYYPTQVSTNVVQVSDGTPVSLSPDMPTGTVTIKFSSADGSLVSSPYVNGSAAFHDSQNNTTGNGSVTAYGPSTALAENYVTFSAMPGSYSLSASAYVNGSYVTFSPKTVVVIKGVETVLEINGPSLTVNSPTAGIYTTDLQTTVAGIANDDKGVTSLTVNGVSVPLTSTNNPNAPNEVSFNTTIPLVPGTNKIVVQALDAAGKKALDTRFVYWSKGPPALSFTPATGTVTQSSTVTVNGTATDDNGVASISLNGQSVVFMPTNNPNDPNEVAFSYNVNLNDGPNTISVVVTDNVFRVTSAAAIVTKANKDVTPPTLSPVSDVLLSQINAQGTPNTLTSPTATDDQDPNPVVTSDAPAVFPAGVTTVIWTATDATGNKATETQKVTVVDLTPPTLSAVSSVTLEQASAAGTANTLTAPTATDAVDPSPAVTSNAPALFPAGVTVVTWTATDASGNKSTEIQTVTVKDTTPPTLSAVSNVTLEQASAAGTAYTLPAPTAADAVDPHPVVTSNAPAVFPAGVTVVTWTATDASGNKSTETQTVTVKDTTPPTLSPVSGVTLQQTTAAGVPNTLAPPTATDTVDPHPVVTSNAPTVFPVGVTAVTWTATDAAGNQSTETQTVTVTAKDMVGPILYVDPSRTILPETDTLVPVWVWLKAVDAVDGNVTKNIRLVSVTSDEPKRGNVPDIVILGRNLILLRAEADKNGNGRVYTLTYQVSDKAGNVTTVSKTIEVRKKPAVPAINSGIAYTVVPGALVCGFDSDGDGQYRDDRFDNGRHWGDRQDSWDDDQYKRR